MEMGFYRRGGEAGLDKRASGNIQRIDNFLEALPVRENNCKQKLEELEKQLETAKVEVKKEFEKEDELAEKSKRLEELNVLLNEDNKKNDTQEIPQEKRKIEIER